MNLCVKVAKAPGGHFPLPFFDFQPPWVVLRARPEESPANTDTCRSRFSSPPKELADSQHRFPVRPPDTRATLRIEPVSWLESWTADPEVEGSNPIRSAIKTVFFRVKKDVLTRCRCPQTQCVYVRIRKTMYAR